MNKLAKAPCLFLLSALLTACSQQPAPDAAQKFFAKNKIGPSPDYAIIKFGNINDHVITVHGFGNDLASCMQVSDALNVAACKETDGSDCLNPYSCRILN